MGKKKERRKKPKRKGNVTPMPTKGLPAHVRKAKRSEAYAALLFQQRALRAQDLQRIASLQLRVAQLSSMLSDSQKELFDTTKQLTDQATSNLGAANDSLWSEIGLTNDVRITNELEGEKGWFVVDDSKIKKKKIHADEEVEAEFADEDDDEDDDEGEVVEEGIDDDLEDD